MDVIKDCDNMSLFKCAYVRWQLKEVYYIDICFYVRYHKSMTYKVPHKHAIQNKRPCSLIKMIVGTKKTQENILEMQFMKLPRGRAAGLSNIFVKVISFQQYTETSIAQMNINIKYQMAFLSFAKGGSCKISLLKNSPKRRRKETRHISYLSHSHFSC